MKVEQYVSKIYERLLIFIPTIIIYTYVIYALRTNNHFFGLNKSSTMIRCM